MRRQKHTEPQPYFLKEWEKLPSAAEGWSLERKSTTTHVLIAIRSIRFTDGSSRRYFKHAPRCVTAKEQARMREAAAQILKSAIQDQTAAIVKSERKLLKRPTPPKQRGKKGAKNK